MGNLCSVKGAIDHWIYVKTGDRKGAGSDASIGVKLVDDQNRESEEIKLDCTFRNDFERGRTDVFQCPPLGEFGKVVRIELSRDDSGFGADWYCEVIIVHDRKVDETYYFPVQRWVQPNRSYLIYQFDTFLPQHDPVPEQRRYELESARAIYRLGQRGPEMPMQIVDLPEDECFSDEYKWDIMKTKFEMLARSMWARVTEGNFKSLQDVKQLYDGALFETPRNLFNNSMESDYTFGAQRLIGCNPTMIKLCKELPKNMALTPEMLRPYLEGWTLDQVVVAKRLFMVDLKILEELPTIDDNPICCPIALFFLNSSHLLIPIAIQLYQDIAEDNPVFMPGDPVWTWRLAKLWFNHADAAIHQSLSHLGFTHLLMEGICCSMHRHLAPNHPIHRLLAPHFLFLLAINSRGLETLLAPDGWVDKTMSIGREGMFELMRRGFEEWRIDIHGCLPKDLEVRGVHDPRVLPHYGYRDDALLYYKAIERYVYKIVKLYYPKPPVIAEDAELQSWIGEMALPKEQGGIGVKGLPNNGRFLRYDDLMLVLTSIIFTCSVQHAAVNFPQYDEYAFPVNYPGFLQGMPPEDKRPKSEADIVEAHPTISQTLDAISVTKILSQKATKSLGDWEFQFQYDPEALKAEEQFREELKEVGKTIEKRNRTERPEVFLYEYLTPDQVPNAISI